MVLVVLVLVVLVVVLRVQVETQMPVVAVVGTEALVLGAGIKAQVSAAATNQFVGIY